MLYMFKYSMIETYLIVLLFPFLFYFAICSCVRIQVPLHKVDLNTIHAQSLPSSCLEEGWCVPADIPNAAVGWRKVNTFMACPSRIDDSRMLKVKKLAPDDEICDTAVFLGGTYSVLERERMLGFQDGYVKDALDELYTELLTKALAVQIIREKVDIEDELDAKYQVFSGQKFKYSAGIKDPMDIVLEIGEPRSKPTVRHWESSNIVVEQVASFFSPSEFSRALTYFDIHAWVCSLRSIFLINRATANIYLAMSFRFQVRHLQAALSICV